jgi:hypothetical protein
MENKMQRLLSDVPVNATFTVNGVQYKKIDEVKVSCCRSINAEAVDNPSNKTFFPGNTLVETNG